MHSLSSEEALKVTDAFLATLYTNEVYERWTEMKRQMNFTSEREFVVWMMDYVESMEKPQVLLDDDFHLELDGATNILEKDTETHDSLQSKGENTVSSGLSRRGVKRVHSSVAGGEENDTQQNYYQQHDQNMLVKSEEVEADVVLDHEQNEFDHMGGGEGLEQVQGEERVILLDASPGARQLPQSAAVSHSQEGGGGLPAQPKPEGTLWYRDAEPETETTSKNSLQLDIDATAAGDDGILEGGGGVHDEIEGVSGPSHPLQCEYCDKRFTSPSGRRHHIRVVHQRILKYHCDHCHYSSGKSSNVRRHMTLRHNQPSQYQCHSCLKYFTGLATIRKHWETSCQLEYDT